MAIQVKTSGPLFDGHAGPVLAKMAADCQTEVAKAAEDVWQTYMDVSFRNPTGYYQSHINIARRSQDLVVNDAGVIYGHWLEGTGSRNFPVTRFKGYASARRAEQYVDRIVPELCAPVVARAVEEMNRG